MSKVGSWIEQVVGQPLPTTSPLVSPAGIAERRAFYETLPPFPDPAGAIVVDECVVLTAEIYAHKNRASETLPPFLFLHGGAFCIWNARMVRRAAMRVAAAGFRVLNLNYRLAPEHPYPAALTDVIHAARWIYEHGPSVGFDPSGGLSIGGDSSGANLAAAATSYFLSDATHLDGAATGGQPVRVRQILLCCGLYDIGRRLIEKSSGPGTTEIMVNQAYLGPQFLTKHSDPLVSPARATNLDRFPRVFIACGSRDNTLPQSLSLAATLADLDVDVTLSVFPRGDHEMLLLSEEQLPGVEAEWSRISAWLTDAWTPTSRTQTSHPASKGTA
jgi:monoterpene epsilon-lactone hydrolase